MGLFNRSPDYKGEAWLGYWDGPAGEASRCFVEYVGHAPMLGHLPAAALEAVVTYHMLRDLNPPVAEMVEFAASAKPVDGETPLRGVELAPGGPEFLSTPPPYEAARWHVGFSIATFPKKRIALSEAQVRHGGAIDARLEENVFASEKIVRAWYDCLRWVVIETGVASALATREVVDAIAAASRDHSLPPGRAAWEAAEKTSALIAAVTRSQAAPP